MFCCFFICFFVSQSTIIVESSLGYFKSFLITLPSMLCSFFSFAIPFSHFCINFQHFLIVFAPLISIVCIFLLCITLSCMDQINLIQLNIMHSSSCSITSLQCYSLCTNSCRERENITRVTRPSFQCVIVEAIYTAQGWLGLDQDYEFTIL